MSQPNFKAGIYNSTPWVGITGPIEHEYDEAGNHRLVNKGRIGDWADFASIAILKIDDRLFWAVTRHHAHCDEIIEAQPVAPRSLVDIYRST